MHRLFFLCAVSLLLSCPMTVVAGDSFRELNAMVDLSGKSTSISSFDAIKGVKARSMSRPELDDIVGKWDYPGNGIVKDDFGRQYYYSGYSCGQNCWIYNTENSKPVWFNGHGMYFPGTAWYFNERGSLVNYYNQNEFIMDDGTYIFNGVTQPGNYPFFTSWVNWRGLLGGVW